MGTCRSEKCDNPSRTGGKCSKHYAQGKYGHESPEISQPYPECSVSFCDLTANSRNQGSLCDPHYQLKWRGVDPNTRRIRKDGKGSRETCWVGDCVRVRTVKGLCNYHYRRARTGRLEVPAELGVGLNSPCSFEECSNPSESKNLCHGHYEQFRKGVELKKLRDYGRYVKGEHVCSVRGCKGPCIASGLCSRHFPMVSKYRVTPDRLVEIWSNPICSNSGCGETTRLQMDHDHDSGEFRGLLCNGCNAALGFLKENPERLLGLREYIESFR